MASDGQFCESILGPNVQRSPALAAILPSGAVK